MAESPDWPRAFARAADARTAIDQIVEQTSEGVVDLQRAYELADRQPLIGRVFALKVLEALPGVGKVQARRTMAGLEIEPDITLQDLSDADRRRLLEAFSPH